MNNILLYYYYFYLISFESSLPFAIFPSPVVLTGKRENLALNADSVGEQSPLNGVYHSVRGPQQQYIVNPLHSHTLFFFYFSLRQKLVGRSEKVRVAVSLSKQQ